LNFVTLNKEDIETIGRALKVSINGAIDSGIREELTIGTIQWLEDRTGVRIEDPEIRDIREQIVSRLRRELAEAKAEIRKLKGE